MLEELLPPEDEEEESPLKVQPLFQQRIPAPAEVEGPGMFRPTKHTIPLIYETDNAIPEIISLEETEVVSPVLASRIKRRPHSDQGHSLQPAIPDRTAQSSRLQRNSGAACLVKRPESRILFVIGRPSVN
ncbi:MAG: hypothetical protein IPM52_11395 [Bacteroidetes bacterium]|nr:hypothetical protein [Bacteroidota bacterium]